MPTVRAQFECVDMVHDQREGRIAKVGARISEVAETDWRLSCYRDGSEIVCFRWQPTSWNRNHASSSAATPSRPAEQVTGEGREWHYWALVGNEQQRSADQLEH